MTKTFESENGFYKLEYPENFKISYKNNILNIYSYDNSSALTVSSYFFENGIDDSRFSKMFETFTKDYVHSDDKVELNKNIWIQRFIKQSENEKVIWTMCLKRNDKVSLVISINFGENERDIIIDQYQQIFQTIVNLGA